MVFQVRMFVYYVPLYLRGHTIHEGGGKVTIGSFIHEVAVIDGSFCSRFYSIVFLCSPKSPHKCSTILLLSNSE